MIAVARPAEPERFDALVRQPGRTWLREHPDAKRPKDLWTLVSAELAMGFGQRCGYSAMHEPVGTVDHFVSIAADRSLAYEWSNYRFASAWINSAKQNQTVLDPFDVQDGWFEIELPSLELRVTDATPSEWRELADHTLTRLHLRDDERIMRQRQAWYELYREGALTLEGLHGLAPLIARAVVKQQAKAIKRDTSA
jgi:hypothetical protein